MQETCRFSTNSGVNVNKCEVSEQDNHSFAFNVLNYANHEENVRDACNSVLVDCGATAHIITKLEYFTSFNVVGQITWLQGEAMPLFQYLTITVLNIKCC